MAKKTIRENIRVEVLPDFGWSTKTEDQQIRIAQDISSQIKRHVDDVQSAHPDWDSKEICTDCNYEWEVDNEGRPVCCEKAQKEWDQANCSHDEYYLGNCVACGAVQGGSDV